uniref:Uncharacterized protein n=1 Tax=Globodera rostochiensis TaxID=31243 RepID=A0A914I0B3_GLORO
MLCAPVKRRLSFHRSLTESASHSSFAEREGSSTATELEDGEGGEKQHRQQTKAKHAKEALVRSGEMSCLYIVPDSFTVSRIQRSNLSFKKRERKANSLNVFTF